MSIVAVLKGQDKIWMACDSRLTNGHGDILQSNTSKIFKVPPSDRGGECLIGWAGDLSLAQRLIKLFMAGNATEDIFIKYKDIMQNSFLDLLKEINKESVDLDVIMACDGNIYEFNASGGIVLIDDFTAIGMGYAYAIGCMHMVAFCHYDESVVMTAVHTAIDHCCACGGEVHIEHINIEED